MDRDRPRPCDPLRAVYLALSAGSLENHQGGVKLVRSAAEWLCDCTSLRLEDPTMRWTSGDRSNVEDMRGRSGGGMALGAGGLGVGGLLLLLVLSWATGVDLTSIVGGGGSAPPASVGTSGSVTASPEEERLVDMVDAVMD